jgi:hypothetical protein
MAQIASVTPASQVRSTGFSRVAQGFGHRLPDYARSVIDARTRTGRAATVKREPCSRHSQTHRLPVPRRRATGSAAVTRSDRAAHPRVGGCRRSPGTLLLSSGGRIRGAGPSAVALAGSREQGAPPVDAAALVVVPTISRFFGISIAMFFDDHGPPHFHARHAEGSAKVRIDSLEVIDSSLPRRQLRFVLAWAELHQDELRQNWRRARAGETLQSIEPLQ